MLNIKPEPDFNRLRKVLKREGEPDRVPFYELFADKPIMEAILGKPVEGIKDLIEYQYKLGYDYVTLSASRHIPNFKFPTEGFGVGKDTAELSKGERVFNTASMGVIHSWKDFEEYPWPVKEEIDFSPVEEAVKLVPEGMGVIVRIGHQLEYPMNLMGYERLSYALYDQPDLVEAVFEKVGEIFLYAYQVCAQIEGVGALEISDDLGFKTATMFSPDVLRKYVFPWYKKFVQACHKNDIPIILHSCGNLEAVMDDIIECGIDAKHSFEDQIISVIDFKKKYGKDLAVLGGIDVDFLCRASEEEIRKRTREVLEACMPGGGYALGTGNSVANYIPVNNFLAMLDEGWKVGRY
ncbi:MAG: uroporphyrinogen decarboxylase [Halanaerobiales bacterium]|nr:uroporphyrinogen decarboxylase [Halanaerobiales bacterium]